MFGDIPTVFFCIHLTENRIWRWWIFVVEFVVFVSSLMTTTEPEYFSHFWIFFLKLSLTLMTNVTSSVFWNEKDALTCCVSYCKVQGNTPKQNCHLKLVCPKTGPDYFCFAENLVNQNLFYIIASPLWWWRTNLWSDCIRLFCLQWRYDTWESMLGRPVQGNDTHTCIERQIIFGCVGGLHWYPDNCFPIDGRL